MVDVGTGDGRFAYRLARAHPSWLCVGVDADARSLAPVAQRARRKVERGGARNAVFVRMGAAELPGPLEALADEIWVNLPWATLLDAALGRAPDVLWGIARLGRPGAALHVTVNASAIGADGPPAGLEARYAAAGIRLERVWSGAEAPSTSWAKRLGGGRPVEVLRLEGTVRS